ncbi:MAG: hypothetical protein WCK21_07535 [Actinomycetota bacterium]
MSRATPLLIHTTLPLRDLLLDPGDELSITQDPAGMPDASFVRAFVPLRAYQRLSAGGLDGLKQKIQKYPESLVRRILARADGEGSQHVVIDGSWHVAALRHLAEHGPLHRAPLAPVVTELFDACPVTIVPPTTDPALVLALLADPVHHHADPWVRGQRDRLLADLLVSGVHHSKEAVVEALDGDQHAMRRYHAFRALQQLMQHRHVQLHEAPDLYPLFHAAVGRQAIRTWLDWDDGLWCFLDDVALEHFHRMIAPYPAADGAPGGACIRTVDDIVHLCDVLGEPEALRMITDGGRTLHEAVEFINGGAFRHRAGQVSGANAPAQPDRRGIRRNPDH